MTWWEFEIIKVHSFCFFHSSINSIIFLTVLIVVEYNIDLIIILYIFEAKRDSTAISLRDQVLIQETLVYFISTFNQLFEVVIWCFFLY